MQTDRPIIFFDLETTGTDTTTDRICQLSAIKVDADFNVIDTPRKILINPTIRIPAEATAVHGITNEMVKDCPTFKQYATAMYEYLHKCNLAGFNIREFDVPLLSEEFNRCGLKWPSREEKYFDAFRIFRIKEKRDLAAALKFYCNEEMVGAHDAENDVLATIKILKAQILHYPDLTNMNDIELDSFCTDNIRYADVACKLYYNEAGVLCYGFGNPKGKPVKEDSGFGNWMIKSNKFNTQTIEILKGVLYGK